MQMRNVPMIYHETEHGVLYCGDCLEILPTLEVKADMILCDLPYGTTAIAAIRQGKRYIGIDLNPEYCEIAKRRIDAELEQTEIDL